MQFLDRLETSHSEICFRETINLECKSSTSHMNRPTNIRNFRRLRRALKYRIPDSLDEMMVSQTIAAQGENMVI